MIISINGKTEASPRAATYNAAISTVVSLTPPTASPVLKTTLDIKLDSSYPYTLARTDFRVYTVGTAGTVKELRVKSVDDATKTLTVAFGGALSKESPYSLRVEST